MVVEPNTRTSVNLAYNNKEIGLNPGANWSVDLAYRMRRSSLKISYFEEVTSYQFLQLQEGNQIPLLDTAGQPLVDPITNLPLYTFDELVILTDENYLREHGAISMSLRTRRCDISLSGYAESRKYEKNSDFERIYDANMVWEWHFARTMDLTLQTEGQRRRKNTDASSDNLGIARLVLSRQLSPAMSASIEARYTLRDAIQSGFDYREKRLMASISQRF